MIDDRTGGSVDPPPYYGEYVWTRSANQFGWQCLLGSLDPTEHISGYVVPARARDLDRLPPAYISVGALDLFLEENLDYASRLMRSGVPVELMVYPGAFHGFELAADAEISRRSEADRRRALRTAFNV